MSDNPPAADADPGGTHAAAHERADQVAGHGDAIEQLRERLDDVEALVHGTVTMLLEDDDEESGPEKTMVEPRTETPPADDKTKDETTPPAEQPKRHSGLFS